MSKKIHPNKVEPFSAKLNLKRVGNKNFTKN